jgi:hypothetical protein
MTLAPPFSAAAADPVDEAFAPPVDAPQSSSEESLLEASAAVKDAAAELTSRVRDTVSLAQRTLRNTARDNPYLLLGSAFGGGFVAGGGLASPLTRALVGVGVRTAGAFLLDAALQTFGQPPPGASQATGGESEASPSSEPHAPPPSSPPSATSETAHREASAVSRPDGLRREPIAPHTPFVPHV